MASMKTSRSGKDKTSGGTLTEANIDQVATMCNRDGMPSGPIGHTGNSENTLQSSSTESGPQRAPPQSTIGVTPRDPVVDNHANSYTEAPKSPVLEFGVSDRHLNSKYAAGRYYPKGYPEQLAGILGIPTPENPLAGIELPEHPQFPAKDEGSSDALSGSKNSTSHAPSGSKNSISGSEAPKDRDYETRLPEVLGNMLGLHQAVPRACPPEPPLLVNSSVTHDQGPVGVAYKAGRLDALREVFQYWESLKDLSAAQVLHEYKALIWWWKQNQKATIDNPELKDERHYQRLADLICVKSTLLMKGVEIDLQNLNNSQDVLPLARTRVLELQL
ncbi:hypothetical protein L211DRAFT_851577 [Terfezia boudieri ATCC MYA-4762]|uniref:Uncharacterized protein n=1 Tax=Terfezia boudieri ATCC MYA-4762 TaxID=1051890 RepID=A0A3N4LE76_9PEZI|nr:hypothetical protein L211DRAFT_851577 [Terfezia boudieri ATCC MYA-4762]